MSNPILPENINNDDADFLFQKRLYHGTGTEQYEVCERFSKNETNISEIAGKQSSSESAATELKNRVNTLETKQQNLTDNQTELIGSLEEHVENTEVHVSTALRNHPNNTDLHLPVKGSNGKYLGIKDNIIAWLNAYPDGGQNGQILGMQNGGLAWLAGGNGSTGTGEITADALFTAMVEMIAMNWESDSNTAFNHPPGDYKAVRCGVYGERFVFVGNRGTIAWSYRGNKWWDADNKPFGESDIYSICYGADTDNSSLYLSIDSTNQYSFSTNGRAWMSAMTRTGDQAFRCCCYGNQTFMIFGRRGTILRATFSEYQIPWRTDSQGNRVSVDWKEQNNSPTELEGINCCCFGLGHFVAGGDLGKIIRSKDGATWTIQNMTPFESSTVQSMAYGNGRIVAVGQNGKIAVTTDPDVVNWRLVEEKPFGAETSIYSVTFGGGIFIAADYYGRIATSSDGERWKLWLPQTEQSVVRAIAYGNMSIVIGNDNGVLSVSDSISKRFTNFDRGEFLEYVDANADWFKAIEEEFGTYFPYILEALAHKPDLGEEKAQPQSLETFGDANNIHYVGTVGESPDAAPLDHRHPSNLSIGRNINSRPLTEKGTAGDSNMAARYDHEHPTDGLVLTKQVGAPNGVAPLDGETLIPLEYMRHGWDWNGLYSTLNHQNISRWYIQPNPMFEDIVSDAVIYAAASNTRTLVVVGEKGRIAYGSHAKRLKRSLNQPFGETPVVGIAAGSGPDGADLFIAVDTTNRYSTSVDGEFWSDAVELDGVDIEGILFGGGMFLIWDSNGYIYRSVWNDKNELEFVAQSSTPLDTAGLHSIAFSGGLFVGVGVDGKIVSSVDADGWELETAPNETPTLLYVFHGNGEFIAVGVSGTIISSVDGKTWTKHKSGRTEDFYSGFYYDGLYLVAGKNGVLISSENLQTGFTSPYDTNITSIIRVVHRHNGVYMLGSDSGQIAVCATFAEILGMIFETDTLAPYNDLPLPLQKESDPGISNRYARGDHVHPTDGLITKDLIGKPGGVAGLDEKGWVPDKQLGKGEPNGVAGLGKNGWVPDGQLGKGTAGGIPPLDEDGLVPNRFLPPLDVNVIIDGMKNNLEFVEVATCFKKGPLQSSILHAGASFAVSSSEGVAVLVGEAGIGYSNDIMNWSLIENQPFVNPVIGVASGFDFDNLPIMVAVDTTKCYSTSRDGIHWSEAVTLDGDYDISHISYYNKTFIITSTNGQILRSIWTSNGISFVEQADGPEFTRGISRVIDGGGKWVGVGNGGLIRESVDASHFTPVESPSTKNLYVIAFGKTRFVAGGEDGELIVTDENGKWLAGKKPFAGNADIMALAYIDTIGTFIATNRIGEVAVSTDLEAWAKIPSTSSVAIRAITTGLNAIVIGDDLGEISASRKVFEMGDIESASSVFIGEKLAETDGLAVVQLCGASGLPTGDLHTGVVMLPVAKETAIQKTFQTTSQPIIVADDDPHSTGWGNLTVDEQLQAASKDNPLNEVDLI